MSLRRKTSANTQYSELVSILDANFEGKLNLARTKFIAMFIVSLCKVQSVTFEKLAIAFDSHSKTSSSLRRIQRFIADFYFDSNIVAKLIFNLLPKKDDLILSIDRTNWKFGVVNINIFMLGIVYKGVAFPLIFKMLDKRGNSNSQERIDLINTYIKLFGKNTIQCIVADREFVGGKWIEYLNFENIKYYIRIRNNFKVYLPHKSKSIKVSWLFNCFQKHQFVHYPKIIQINGQLCYLSGSKLGIKNGKQEYFIIISFNKPELGKQKYKTRWQIEMCFKAFKSSGFDLEKTHLNDLVRIQKLILLTMIAFVWCYKVGIYLNSIEPIIIKTHGRKAISIFKYGLNFIASNFLNNNFQSNINIYDFLSCT